MASELSMECNFVYSHCSKCLDGIRFVLASSVNGEDLTNASFTWYLQYKNKYGQGDSVVLAPTVEDNLVKLTWVPDALAPQVPGDLQIWSNDSSIWI